MKRMRENRENEKITVILVLVIVLIILAAKGISYMKNRQSHGNPFLPGMEVQDFEEYILTQKDVASDIEGMSVYDKYVMGLQRQDGSDSDFDGLTDKEEIETYGSDPLKASTAGDLYSDGYKVANGMDLFTYYEYEGEEVFAYNECPEVSLTASSPTDFYAVVNDATARNDMKEFGVNHLYKTYDLYNYSGRITIDLTDILRKNGVSIDEVALYVADGPFIIKGETKLEKLAFETDGNVADVKYDFTDENDYLIFVTDRSDKVVGSIYNRIFGKFETAEEDTEEESGKALIYGFLFFTNNHVDYTECSTERKTAAFIDNILTFMNVGGGKDNINGGGFQYVSDKFTQSDEKEIDRKLRFFRTIFPNNELKDFKMPEIPAHANLMDILKPLYPHIIFYYCYYDDVVSLTSLYEDETTDPVNSGFDKYVDELPFQNFESYIARGGNCAGISHLSSYLYNTKSVPVTGSYDCTIDGQTETITWDLTGDEANATLYDAGLIDYKTKDFIDSHSSKGNNYISLGLTNGEEEFVNMVGCFWAEGNDRVNMAEYELHYGEYNDVELLKEMMRQIDQGKILDVYLEMRYGGAHAVNIYGYEYVTDNEINFYIYDSNLPQDDRKGFTVDNLTDYCMLQVIIRMNEDGTGSFEYLYWPMTSNIDYLASSYKGLMKSHAIVVMDENWNILN